MTAREFMSGITPQRVGETSGEDLSDITASECIDSILCNVIPISHLGQV
jgi:hypothetical protein